MKETSGPLKNALSVKRVAPVMALAALVAVVTIVILGGATREEVLLNFRVGYPKRITSLLKQGQAGAALDELERASYIDQKSLDMLRRMKRLNLAARFRSQPMKRLNRERLREAKLRFGIGEVILAQLGHARKLMTLRVHFSNER